MNKKTFLIIGVMVGFMALGAGVGIYTAQQQTRPGEIAGLLWPNPKQIHDFETIDEDGRKFGLKQLEGKWSFVFFGYTNCPDVCPITLSVMNGVKEQLNEDEKRETQMIFVSIDPERDTQEKLAQYVHYFNESFIGLGGSSEQIQSLTSQIGVMYFRGEESAEGDYLMDHTSSIFLIDPDMRMSGVLSLPHTVEDLSRRFAQIKAFIEGQS